MSGLFGATSSSPFGGALPGQSSAFGAPSQGAAAGQQTGGLFGAPSTAAAPSGSSLFGQSQSAPTAQSAGGMFGRAATTDNPFGGSTTAPQPQQRPSILGGTSAFGTTSAVPGLSQPAGASMFPRSSILGPSSLGGSTLLGSMLGASTTAPAQRSVFGTTATTAPAPFGTSIASNPTASTNGPKQNLPTGSYFDSLLAKSTKQTDGQTATDQLPSLQLGLGDLRQKLKKLGPREDHRVDGKTHYLLAASGVDPGAAVKDLGSFGVQSGIFDKNRDADGGEVDVETYLTNLQAKTTMSMIADGLERSVRDFDSFLEDNVTMEWDAQRKRIYEHFGIKPRDDKDAHGETQGGGFGRTRRNRQSEGPRPSQRASAFGKSNLQRSVLGSPTRVGTHPNQFSDVDPSADTVGLNGVASIDDRFLREKRGKLAEKIRALNDSRMLHRTYPILYELAEIEPKSGERQAPHLVDAYRAMMEVVGEDPDDDPASRMGSARQRQFAKYYLDPDPNSANSVVMRKRILAGANRHLEKKFFTEVETSIAKYQNEANQGGRPDVVSKIRAFVRVQAAHKKLVPDNTNLQVLGGEYVWAIIFYLLRAGYVTEAATYVNENLHQLRTIDRNFSGYINSYASSHDRMLQRALRDRCSNEYNQRARNAPEGSIDPFRMACYKIVGRCDVTNRSLEGLQTDVNDWIWLQFNLARESDKTAELASESYTLSELQAKIAEVGQRHFPKNSPDDGNGSFGLFFYMQILAGSFEQAISYLYGFSYTDAVHFGIALEYYGLLRAADPFTSGNELLSFGTRNLPQISFGRMIGYYTKDFRAADVAAAVDYLVLICLNMDLTKTDAGSRQAALCYEALRELVLETREFSKLIGDIKPDGQRIKGIIEERGPLIALDREQDFIRNISQQAAGFADDNGRTTDAVLLYHLAGDYDTVVAIVSRALSEAISLEIGEDPMRLVPVKPRVEGSEANAQPGSSLSLAAIDDPVELARTMMTMYERDQMFRQKISDQNRIACAILLQLSEIKALVGAKQWPECLDKIRSLEILPLNAKGDPSVIRNFAAKFSSLAQPVAINVPNLLMWTVVCCTKQRERLLGGQFSGNESTARMLAADLKQISVDLTTYTSQLRYRFPPHLHEALARASAD